MSGNEDLWQKAFQLAFFIVPNRALAHEIAGRAIEKLGAQRTREKRRIYWRFRNVKLRIRRITRTDEDALQWLVYLEAEAFEKQQEASDAQTEADMVIRYVKHLVQLTTGASSFYVNIGLNRLLRSYTTPEVQQIYEFTTQHYPASEEYRKVKARLMNDLTQRFGPLIKVRTSEYRELKFEAQEDQKRWIGIVEECLEFFTPWSSRRACLSSNGNLADTWSQPDHRPGQKDGVETDRCHWFMHSPCYGELARRFNIDSPEERLSVPRFFLPNNNGRDDDSDTTYRKTSPLTDAEKEALKSRIESSDAGRKRAPSHSLKIVAHGITYAQFDPYRDVKRQFAIPNGTGLIEIREEVDSKHLTLAAHWIDPCDCERIEPCEFTVSLCKGREIVFRTIPAHSTSEGDGNIVIEFESRSRSRFAALLNRTDSLPKLNGRLPQYALAALLMLCIASISAAVHYRKKLAQQDSALQQISNQTAALQAAPQKPEQTAPLVASYFLTSENSTVRGTGNPQEPIVTFRPGDSLVMLNLSTSQPTGLFRVTLNLFADDQELLRQNQLKPMKTDKGWVVSFPLPSSAVATDTDYLITLSLLEKTGRTTPVSRFVFKVRK